MFTDSHSHVSHRVYRQTADIDKRDQLASCRHREGKRISGSLPCEEQVESVLSLLNPHLCILPFHRVLLPLLCTPSLHFPYNYNSNYTHTLNHFLPDLQQVAESELSPAAGSARAIAITKEEGVTKRSYRKSPPIALVRPCVVLSSLLVYWFIAPMKYQQACGQR